MPRMSGDLAILQLGSALLGGGAIPLFIAIMRRRSDLREVDARADNATADAHTKYAAVSERFTHRLADEAERQTQRAMAVEARMDEVRAKAEEERAQLCAQLADCQRHGLQLARDIAQLTIKLEQASAEISYLRKRTGIAEPRDDTDFQ